MRDLLGMQIPLPSNEKNRRCGSSSPKGRAPSAFDSMCLGGNQPTSLLSSHTHCTAETVLARTGISWRNYPLHDSWQIAWWELWAQALVFCNHVHLVADRITIGTIKPQTNEKNYLNWYYKSVIVSRLYTGLHRPFVRGVHKGNINRLWPVGAKFLVSKSVIMLVDWGLYTLSSQAAFSGLKQINKRGRCQWQSANIC